MALDRRGLAMPNLGDIAYQTVAGATSTVHPRHRRAASPASPARSSAMRLILADGSRGRLLARRGAGAVPRRSRRPRRARASSRRSRSQSSPPSTCAVVEEPMRVDDVLGDLDAHVDGNDHFEFFWVPHTGWALTKTNNRTTEPLAPRGRVTRVVERPVPAELRVRRAVPDRPPAPAVDPAPGQGPARAPGRVTYVDQSYRVFASPRLVRFYEMEYAIPRAACGEALNRIRALRRGQRPPPELPGRGALHRRRRHPAVDRQRAASRATSPSTSSRAWSYRPYFEGVERIMDDYDGRPHWGKLHFQTAATLARALPAVGPVPRGARPRRSGAALRQPLPGRGCSAPDG